MEMAWNGLFLEAVTMQQKATENLLMSLKSVTYNSMTLDNSQPLKISVLVYEMTIILPPAGLLWNSIAKHANHLANCKCSYKIGYFKF